MFHLYEETFEFTNGILLQKNKRSFHKTTYLVQINLSSLTFHFMSAYGYSFPCLAMCQQHSSLKARFFRWIQVCKEWESWLECSPQAFQGKNLVGRNVEEKLNSPSAWLKVASLCICQSLWNDRRWACLPFAIVLPFFILIFPWLTDVVRRDEEDKCIKHASTEQADTTWMKNAFFLYENRIKNPEKNWRKQGKSERLRDKMSTYEIPAKIKYLRMN